MVARLVFVACGTTGFVRRSENAGRTVRQKAWSGCVRVKSGRISPGKSRAPVKPTPWFARPLLCHMGPQYWLLCHMGLY